MDNYRILLNSDKLASTSQKWMQDKCDDRGHEGTNRAGPSHGQVGIQYIIEVVVVV